MEKLLLNLLFIGGYVYSVIICTRNYNRLLIIKNDFIKYKFLLHLICYIPIINAPVLIMVYFKLIDTIYLKSK